MKHPFVEKWGRGERGETGSPVVGSVHTRDFRGMIVPSVSCVTLGPSGPQDLSDVGTVTFPSRSPGRRERRGRET